MLARADVEAQLRPAALIDELADGFRALSTGEVIAARRVGLDLVARGVTLVMAGRRPGGPVAVKTVSVVEANAARGLPTHLAQIGLFDEATGACLALLDGTHVTAARTAATVALSVRLLARPQARVATVVGAGVQAAGVAGMLCEVAHLDEIRVAGRDPAAAARLAADVPGAVVAPDVEAAVRGSDIVCLATSSPAPVIRADWVRPGTHVASVGYAPPRGELDPVLARAASLFVESREAFLAPPAGSAELAGLDADAATELGEVVAGTRPGRHTPDEITVFKSMGHIVEDLVAATLVWRAAVAGGAGRVVADFHLA